MLTTGLGFLTSALFLMRIRTVEPEPERHDDTKLLPQIVEGLRFVFTDSALRSIVACTATANLFNGVFVAVEILFLNRELGLSPATVGVVLALGGVGGITGAIFANAITRRIGQARSIWLVPALTWPFYLLLPLAAPGWRVLLFPVATMIAGFGIIVYNVAQVSYRQAVCPGRLLGRMNASVRFVVWGMLPLGGLLGGVLGEVIGIRATLWVAVAGETAALLWVVFSPLRKLRDLPKEPVAVG